jgi:hypothetical protein
VQGAMHCPVQRERERDMKVEIWHHPVLCRSQCLRKRGETVSKIQAAEITFLRNDTECHDHL